MGATRAANDAVQALSYSYNANDEITAVGNGIDASLSQTYAYDALSRLTTQLLPGNTMALAYDGVGNRTSRGDNGLSTTYVYSPGGHRLLSANNSNVGRDFSVDTLGNTVGWHGADGVYSTMSYDAYLRPKTQVRNGVTTTYRYNALDQRVGKSNATTAGRYVYTGQNTLLAESVNGQWTSHLYLGGQPVGLVKGNTLYWVSADHLGRPEIVTNAAKQVVWRAANKAFDRGIALDQIGGYNLGFPGQYWDTESNLWHNGFRDYEPSLGRYLQSDPIGLAGGVSTFGYVGGNPIMMVDTLGLITCLLTTVGPAGIRDHAAVYTSRGDGSGGPALYDPAGSYGAANGGGASGIVIGGAANIAKFKGFHRGQTTESTCIETSQKEEESIINKAMDLPSAAPFECAKMSSSALSGQPSFPYVEAGTFLPGSLLRQVRRNGP